MNLKRVLTAIIGLPIVALLIIFGNKYIMDITISIISIISINEFLKCINNKSKVFSVIGYLLAISISFIHIIPEQLISNIALMILPLLFLCMFLYIIIKELKTDFKEMAICFTGLLYIVVFSSFIAILYGIENQILGKILIGYILICSWGSDAVAYIVGKNIGKHKFTKISPNKTIEGCIGGMLGAMVLSVLYTIIVNNICMSDISYIKIVIISILLSIIGQIGDLSASAIKRNFDIKDFGTLFPGHGGMLDRVDSVIFIAPFAYMLLTMFI